MEKRLLIFLFGPLLVLLLAVWVRQNPSLPIEENNNTAAQVATESTVSDKTIPINSIYWSDGDSGRLNGTIKFRLNDIDAPETGGVGAAIGGAKCEAERAKGYDSKAWVVEFTKNMELKITQTHGQDRHERLIIDLSSNGLDVGKSGIDLGHYQPWPHDGKKSLTRRPVWCDPIRH